MNINNAVRKFTYLLIICLLVSSLSESSVAGSGETQNQGKEGSFESYFASDIIVRYPWADVRGFGAKADGRTDDTGAITSALSSSSYVITLPPGMYKVTSGLVIPGGKRLLGSGTGCTRIQFYKDGGTAITLSGGGELSGFSIESKGKSQNGIFVSGIHPVLRNVEIQEFEDIALRLGTAGIVGAYFAEVDNIFILNKKNKGKTGVLVDGLSSPNSNANSFRNVFVKGRLTTLVHLKGNNNSWYGGDTEWDAGGTGVDDVWLIEGIGNIITGAYMESGKGVPLRVFRFTSKAGSNAVRDVYAQFIVQNLYSKTIDEGWGNELNFRPTSFGLSFPGGASGLTNLVPNSHFRNWDGEAPTGWFVREGTFSREANVVKGGAYSLRVVASLHNPIISCYIAGDRSSITGYLIGRFRNKTVTGGVWVKTAKAGMGNIKISVDGRGGGNFGNNTHTGNNAWQFLTAIAKVPEDASYLALQLRGFESGVSSGEVYFSEPVLLEGVHLPDPSPASLNDSFSKMTGVFVFNTPILFADGDGNPSVKDGNIFKTVNSSKTTIEGFKNGSPGQKITVIFADSNTTVDFKKTPLKGHRGMNWTPSKDDHMTCVHDGGDWYCDVSINTPEKTP